jgi:hypothetical protein
VNAVAPIDDIVDAHFVFRARRQWQTTITCDPRDLRWLDLKANRQSVTLGRPCPPLSRLE